MPGADLSTRCVCNAIINSSFAGMTHPETRLPAWLLPRTVIACDEPRLASEPLDLAAHKRLRCVFIEEDGKLEAR